MSCSDLASVGKAWRLRQILSARLGADPAAASDAKTAHPHPSCGLRSISLHVLPFLNSCDERIESGFSVVYHFQDCGIFMILETYPKLRFEAILTLQISSEGEDYSDFVNTHQPS